MPRLLPGRNGSPVAPRRESPRRQKSPLRRERSPPSPRRGSSRRSISPIRNTSSHKLAARSPPSPLPPPPPPREKHHTTHNRSPKRTEAAAKAKPQSPPRRSLSPRSKRLKRAQAEKEVEREHERNGSGRERDRVTRHRETAPEKEVARGRDERGKDSGRKISETARDDIGEKGAKTRRDRSVSPVDREVARERVGREKDSDRRRGERDGIGEKGSKLRRGRSVSPLDREVSRERGGGREKDSERKRGERDGIGEKGVKLRRDRSVSPVDHRRRDRHASRSPDRATTRNEADDEERNTRGTEQGGKDNALSKMQAAQEALEAKKQQPSFELSGKLAAETNRVRGVTLLFNEPPDAQKPDIRWRLYVFKAAEVLKEPLYIHRQSCYLFGRERRVADIPTDHPSCSKQHAVIQFRKVAKEQPDGSTSTKVRPYVMDLGSTNKTFLNDNPIEPQRYYELFEKDTIKFGNSSREYVLLHENSA